MRIIPARALATALLVVLVAPAMAHAQTTFDFANLKWNGSANTGFLPTNGTGCTSGDRCSAKGGPLSFTKDGFTIDAYAFYNGGEAMVVQDHENNYSAANKIGAGLGVYHKFDSNGIPNDPSDDNITLGEMLKLQFNTAVSLQSINLRSDGHNVTQWLQNEQFEYSTDGTQWTSAALPLNTGTFTFANALTTSAFYVRYASRMPDQFYLSGATVASVPEPNTVLCVTTGLIGLAAVARRRRRV